MNVRMLACALVFALASGASGAQQYHPRPLQPSATAPAPRGALQTTFFDITCPIVHVSASMAEPTPPGWSFYPVQDGLDTTYVFSRGPDHPAELNCRYLSAATVRRDAPAGRECEAQTGGFHCHLPATHAAPPTGTCPPGTLSIGGVCVPTSP